MKKTECLEVDTSGNIENIHLTLTIEPDAWKPACIVQLNVSGKNRADAYDEMCKMIREVTRELMAAQALFGGI